MQYPSDWQSVGGASNFSIVASFNRQRNYASYFAVQIENLSTGYTPDQYLNSLMLGDAADYKDFPDIRFNQNTTNNIVLAGHPGYLLNGTFRDPTSDVLQRFTNIGTIIGDKVYSIIYYSPAETYPIYRTIYDQMIKSFEIIPQNNSTVNPAVSTYENRNYGILIKYPSDWDYTAISCIRYTYQHCYIFLSNWMRLILLLIYPHTSINFKIRLQI